ncbi:hypothetical protein [Parerythrobacter lacustris]|uniref:Uncharacterized protein n=1 Tax=Parerythrobacter lacustris TaxID=2969984 RepID=A0ABT1XLM1_9SPHN|nr:hypothetical protein [Parerythrobacter lacustris]MCR2832553.1 hypothetical protein [Parerythrobacter lacustris]
MTYEFDCDAGRSSTLRLEGLASDGTNLGSLLDELGTDNLVQPNTFGAYALQFACFEAEKNEPDLGYATMLSPIQTADHFFRLIGIGLDREIAAGLAGYDAERAPLTFEMVLNALVPTDLHLYVRAIKTPNASVE